MAESIMNFLLAVVAGCIVCAVVLGSVAPLVVAAIVVWAGWHIARGFGG